MEDFFKLVRESCSSVIWSRGVELARGEAVVGESLSDAEAVLRVASPGRPVSATVKLWIEDEDWFCDCQSAQNPCEHVAAATIALKRSREGGKSLSVSGSSRGLVRYHFLRRDGALAFERRIQTGEKEVVLESTLNALIGGRVPGPAVSATKEDLGVDSLLGARTGGVFTAEVLAALLLQLRGSESVFLDGTKTSTAAGISGRQACVRDAEGGVFVSLERAADIEESFSNGVVRVGGALRPLVTPEFSIVEKEIASRGKLFRPIELAELATSVLPDLREKMAVEIATTRLPVVGEDSRPRLVFQTESRGEVLSVLPVIVYGDPPYARIDSGKLVLLGDAHTVPDRNRPAEARLASELQSDLGLSVGKRLEYRGEAATRFAAKLKEKPRQLIGAGVKHFESRPPLEAQLTLEGGRLSVKFSTPESGLGAETTRVFEAWRQGLMRVPLLDGSGYAPLPVDWLDRYGHRVLELLQAKDSFGEVPKMLRPELARLCEELDVPCPPELSRLRAALETYTGLPVAKLPLDLKATLRSYQHRGVDWLAFLRDQKLGALLADDMGLGKTLQTICVLRGQTLIVAPTSVLPNWKKEIERFRPSLRVGVYHGANRRLHPPADVTLTTYALMRIDNDTLASVEWDTVVLDEAQNIKNPESQVAQAAFRLRGENRIALSGTPVENRLEDLWSLFHFLNRGLLGGRDYFRQRYAGASEREAADLRRKIRPFLLRRLKKEVAPELPPRTDVVVYCELDKAERNAYEAILAATRKEVAEVLGQGGGILKALECLLRLRQASCHRGLLPGSVGEGSESSSKVRLLVERLEEAASEGHKALVFSQWTSLLDRIEPELDKVGLGHCRIDGSTSDRMAVVDRFQSPEGPPVLLMTLKAGGTGLNLTAADHVFLVDPWWNPAAEDQAADRAHRIGQDRPVIVHRLVARDTVEEKILALQDVKRAAADAALTGSGSAAALSRDDLIELLRD